MIFRNISLHLSVVYCGRTTANVNFVDKKILLQMLVVEQKTEISSMDG